MDGLTMRRLTTELDQLLTGSKIEKIYQPGDKELVLLLRPPGRQTYRLMISAHKQFARVHLLEDERPDNPKEPPMFCMLMRKYIEGGRVTKISQHGWDRVFILHIEAIDEVGDIRQYQLIAEVMGRHSNLMLCRTDEQGQLRIVDSIIRVTEFMSRYREVVPGAPYLAPPAQDKPGFDHVDEAAFVGIDTSNWLAKTNVQNVVSVVAGIGPVTAKEALYRTSIQIDKSMSNASQLLYQTVGHLVSSAINGTESVSVSLDSMGRATECAPYVLTHRENFAHCPTMSEGIRRRFADNGEMLYHSHLQDELQKTVLDHLDKLRGKRVKLEQSLKESTDEGIYRIKAELLTAYAYQIEKGETRVVLPNYYDENEPIAIDLDPALDPIGNAQRYFKQATKRKRAATSVAAQLEETHLDMQYLEDVIESLRDSSLENLEQVRSELLGQGFLQEKQKKRRPKPSKTSKPARVVHQPEVFESSDGLTIQVGRNNLQNDRLTFRSSDGRDIWFHVKDQPGAHVVIRRENYEEIPEATIEEAAILAAYFSRGRDSANVPVDMTEIRYVWKPNGARPGFALYDHQTTVFVTPDRSIVDPILQRRMGQPIK